jgi:hypothetical protein
VELGEVVILAIVAVATAWTGFQAAEWDGEQSFLYGEASRDRFEAEELSTAGGQHLVSDSAIFTAWLEAHATGAVTLENELVRRFTPDYQVAFQAWLRTDPFTNASAPPGPAQMPQYHNHLKEQAKAINARASESFSEGTEARETGDRYVRATVLFASVLFLVALGQRFKSHNARLAVNVIATGVLLFTVATIVSLPRA